MESKIAFVSLGCDKNLIDSEIMLGLLNEEGYTLTPDEEEADVVIINTCGFILDATEEGVENVLRIAGYKKRGRLKALIVTGCMAQRYKEQIFEEIPEVDAVVGTGGFEKIGTVIKDVLSGKQVSLITDINNSPGTESRLKRIISTPNYFAYLKIAEGCDSHCTYCTIPSLRGKYRSVEIESLVKEAEMLAAKGVCELILIAQDTGLYGKDLYGEPKLHTLLRKLSEVPGIRWIRILYCYPEHITDDIINEIYENKKVCHYLDMPIQHACDRILKRMGRRSTREKIISVISRLREKIGDMCIRTTLIVGFPGETDDEFNSLVDFIKEMEFDRLGVFAYSREDGTPAHDFKDQIDEEIKQERKQYILDVQKNISLKKCGEWIGKTLEVVVEGRLPDEDIYCGRSFRDCYEIDGLVFFKNNGGAEPVTGEFLNIKITEASDYDLMGDVCSEPCQ